eukprot:COSAG04_NODE_379_length_15473_cov_3.329322_9_plen_148_part_00
MNISSPLFTVFVVTYATRGNSSGPDWEAYHTMIGSALMRERPRRPLEGEYTSKRKSFANAFIHNVPQLEPGHRRFTAWRLRARTNRHEMVPSSVDAVLKSKLSKGVQGVSQTAKGAVEGVSKGVQLREQTTGAASSLLSRTHDRFIV